MNWIWCLDIVVLAFMLVYVLAASIHASCRSYIVRRRLRIRPADRSQRKLAADLRIKTRTLNALLSKTRLIALAGLARCVNMCMPFFGPGVSKDPSDELVRAGWE